MLRLLRSYKYNIYILECVFVRLSTLNYKMIAYFLIYIYTYLHTAHISCDISPNMVLLHWLYPFFLNCKTSTWTMSTQENLIWKISEHPPTGDLLHSLSYSWENSWLYLADDSRHLCCQPKRVVHSPLASRSLGVIMTYKPGKSFEPFFWVGRSNNDLFVARTSSITWPPVESTWCWSQAPGIFKTELFVSENRPSQKGKQSYSNHPFSGVFAVSSGRLLWFFLGGLDFHFLMLTLCAPGQHTASVGRTWSTTVSSLGLEKELNNFSKLDPKPFRNPWKSLVIAMPMHRKLCPGEFRDLRGRQIFMSPRHLVR